VGVCVFIKGVLAGTRAEPNQNNHFNDVVLARDIGEIGGGLRSVSAARTRHASAMFHQVQLKDVTVIGNDVTNESLFCPSCVTWNVLSVPSASL